MRTAQLLYLLFLFLLTSCYREDIQFEGDPPDSYTQVVRIDTITPVISTVIIDSFATGGASTFLLGAYDDPHFGSITARPFFQIDKPGTVTIAEKAVFDSLVLIVHLNKYYYGDSTDAVNIDVHELDESLVLGYNDKLYNNSDFSVKASPLGSKQVKIYPNINDSVIIRLSDAKGQELFNKIRAQDDELSTTENFLNYFKGIRISTPNGKAVYGLDGAAGQFIMRLHYHTTIPLPQDQRIDFPSLSNQLAFRQILVDRNGTLPTGKNEFPSSETNHIGYSQPATGALMKIVFPGLRNILNTDKPLNLLHAELMIRPVNQSFTHFSLPPSLLLFNTNESNFVEGVLRDSTGEGVLSASPVIDRLYGVNNHYRFNITNFINVLLHTTNSAGDGFFVLESTPEQAAQLNRVVFGDAMNSENKAQLILSVVTVNID